MSGGAVREAPRIPATPLPVPPPRPRRPALRPDVEGLRAVAILLVVLAAARVPGLRGGGVGVDVFFVLAGFLLCGRLIGGQEHGDGLELRALLVRRARRLAPVTTLVVLVGIVAARIWLPAEAAHDTALDALAAALGVLNLRLAADARTIAAPLEHLWVLSAGLQACALLALAVWACGAHRQALVRILAAIAALSFAAAVVTSGPWADRGPQTHAWPVALGALVGLAGPRLSIADPRRLAVASWAGLVALALAALVVPGGTAPAAVAVAGTLLVLAAGCAGPHVGAGAVLARRPLQGLGRAAFPWYLLAWPALVLGPALAGEPFGWVRNTEVVALALWPAVVLHLLVEGPARDARLSRRTWLRGAAAAAAALTAAGLACTLTLPAFGGAGPDRRLPSSSQAATAAYATQVHNAIAASVGLTAAPGNLRPVLPGVAGDTPPATDEHCLEGFARRAQGACVTGDPSGSRTVVLLGDSHADMWRPAFAEAGRRAGWKVVSWAKAACPVAELPVRNADLGRTYWECLEWRDQVLGRVRALHPDLVIVSQSDSTLGLAVTDRAWADGTTQTLYGLRGAGIPTAYLLDTPRPAGDVPACLTAHLADVRACNAPVAGAGWIPHRRAALAARLRRSSFPLIDPRPWLCTATTCPPIVGNLVVFRDALHLTATYSAWLAPFVQRLLVHPPKLAR